MNNKNIVDMVYKFNRVVRGETQPIKPQQLTVEQHQARAVFMSEEVLEFAEATTPEAELDALVDVIYFAIGGMYEMGLKETQVVDAFNKVHNANMAKAAGKKAERESVQVTDAVKPADWAEPDLAVYFTDKCCGCGGCDGKE